MTCKEVFSICALLAGVMTLSDALIIAVNSNNYKEVYGDYELKISDNITGIVVYMDPYNVCYNLTQPPPELLKNQTNCFLLTEEGICPFEEMAKSAEAAGYSAIIMYVSSPRIPVLFKKHIRVEASFSTYNITSVLVSEDSGQRIIKRFLYTVDPGSRLHIIANESQLKNIFIIFLINGGIFVVLVLLFVLIKCIQQNYRRSSFRLRSRHLKHLPIKKFKSDDPYETCAICLEDYRVKEKLRILPCSHAYHCKCIDPWLTNNRRTCPVCKQKVNIPGVHEEEDDDSNSDTDSRAETAPLIGFRRRQQDHGTFTVNSAHQRLESESNAIQIGSDTSRDVTSDALDESIEEEVAGYRPSSSAPNILMSCANLPTSQTSHSKRQSQQPLITTADIDCENEDSDCSGESNDSSLVLLVGKERTYVV